MRSPHEQIMDLVVKMDARGARKVRDMADAHLRDLGALKLEAHLWDAETLPHRPWQQAGSPAPLDTCKTCGVIWANHTGLGSHPFVSEGAELQRGLEEAVVRERERLDGPDDDSEEPAGQIGHTDDF